MARGTVAPTGLDDANRVKVRGAREDYDYTCMRLLHTRTRFVLMMMVLLCLASVWSNILSFNFAVICFINSDGNTTAAAASGENSTAALIAGVSGSGGADEATQFTLRERSYLTSAVAASALIANFVIVALVNRHGIRVVFTILGFASALATAALPALIRRGFEWTLAARVVQGIAFAANFPVIGAFTAKYTYYKQNGLFVSVLVAYVQFSPTLTMPISGELCESRWGWPSVFYAHAAVSCVMFVLFGIFYRNSPKKHPFIGQVELAKIAIGKSTMSKKELRNIPYGSILSTASVWAVWLAALGNFTAVNVMFLYSPTYMSRVLRFPVHSSGLSSALAPFSQFVLKVLAGFTSDKVRCLAETNKLRLYNTIAFFVSAAFLTALAFAPPDAPMISLVLFGCSAGALGFTTGGFFKAGPLVSKQFSHFVTGNISLGITITMLIVPFIVDGLAPDSTSAQWRHVFLVLAGVLVLSNLLFVLMCSATPAAWTGDDASTRGTSATTTTRSTVAVVESVS